MRPELKGLNGGSKQFWLRTHRAEVERFYYAHGPEATMAEFNIKQATLERFWTRRGDDQRHDRLSRADREILKIAMEGDRELKRRISELEEWKSDIDPFVQSVRGLVKTTLGKLQGEVGITALPCDPLELDDLVGKSEK